MVLQSASASDAPLPRPRAEAKKRSQPKYWIAGLPVAIRHRRLQGSEPIDRLRHAYARFYWRRGKTPAARRRRAFVAWLPTLLGGIVRYTLRNGVIIRKRSGVGLWRQAAGQLAAGWNHGILPRWYYIFSLHDHGARASAFLNRFETKPALFQTLNRAGSTPLGDKADFAAHCSAHGLSHIPVLAIAYGGSVERLADLPPTDLFVKPIAGRGGRGAQRWRWNAGQYCGPQGDLLSGQAFLERLADQSRTIPHLVQPNMVNHSDIADLGNGALATVRFLTCLDERGEPEIFGASFRMPIGKDCIVDNIHAGGIAAAVDLETGMLGEASNLGADARLGWLSSHPDTGAPIEGRILPGWRSMKELAIAAHRAFADRVVVGWDIALLQDGPCLVEGNSGPDVDLIQRPLRRGIGEGRFAELLDFHLRRIEA